MDQLTHILIQQYHLPNGLINFEYMKSIKILFVVLFVSLGGYSQSPEFIDSLLQEIKKPTISDSAKVEILLTICYCKRNSPVEALSYGEEALKLAQKSGLKKYESYAYGYIGESENKLGNRGKCIEALINSANLFFELKLNDQLASILNSIGVLFMQDGDIINSVKYYKQGLELFLLTNDTLNIANTLSNIGEAYRIDGVTDSAAYYFNKALAYYNEIEIGDIRRINIGKNNLIGNLGMVHFQQGKIELARKELSQALLFFEENEDPYRASVYKSEMGKLLIEQGNMEEGKLLINESLEIAKGAKLKDQIRDFNFELSSFYEQQSEYQQALYHFKQYKIYDDSLKNVENVRKMEQQQSQFQLSKKEEEIAVLNKINSLQRGLGYAMMGGVFIVIVFFFNLFQSNKKIKFQNKKITEQSLIVEQREQEKALLLKELNHRVKNNLQMVASLLNLHSRQLKDHPAAEALMEGKYRVEALTLIHQKLYCDDVDTMINIKDYIEELVQNLILNFGQKFQLVLNLEPFVMKIDKAIPLGLIVNELVTNSLKYGHEKNNSPVLKINVEKNKSQLVLTIEDNGVGLAADFDFSQTESFGLKLVHSLVKQLGGNIKWTANEGTQWELEFDLLKIC